MACGRIVRNVGLRWFHGWRIAALAVALLLTGAPDAPAAAALLKASVTVTVSGGYARLLFTSSDYIDASVRVAGNVLIVSFKQPLDMSVDRIPDQASDYIGAARRDPDGKAVRMALVHHVTVNTMAAGEKFFVDLLPDTWKGIRPGLPQDVVDDLTRRAREADEVLRRERQQQKKVAAVRVHVAVQPTFTRYIFDITDQTSVSADRSKDRLILNFDTPLSFDLGEAHAALPDSVEDISSEIDGDAALVRFMFAAKVDVRTFRDEKGYVVDVVNPGSDVNKPNPVSSAAPAGAMAASQPPNPPNETGAPKVAAARGEAPAAIAAPQPAAAMPVAPPPESAAQPPQLPPTMTPQAVPQGAAPMAAPTVPRPAEQTMRAAGMPSDVPPMASTPTASPPLPSPQSVPKSPQRETKAAPALAGNDVAAPAPSPKAPTLPAPAVAKTSAMADTGAAPAAPIAESAKPESAKPESAKPESAKPESGKPESSEPQADNPPPGTAGHKVGVELSRDGDSLKLSFPFSALPGTAIFHRADALWIVFDSTADFDLSALDNDTSRTIRGYDFSRSAGAAVVRLKLDRPHLSSIVADGTMWSVEIGDAVLAPSHGLDLVRNVVGPNRSNIAISLAQPQQLHRLVDPDVGDTLFVVTALPPARGFVNEQDFIEFHLLASTQGVVIQPLADDIDVVLAPDRVVVRRPAGLTLSTSSQTLLHGSGMRPAMFDSQVWGFDREASYVERQDHLIAAAAAAPKNKRLAPRLDLARFYLARDMYPEAKGVLDVAMTDEHGATQGAAAAVLRAIAEVMMDRPEAALKDLADPAVGDQHDAPLWRALIYARQGKWAQARDGFKLVEAAIATLPIELQRIAIKYEMRAAIEAGDFDGASRDLNDFQTIGVPHDLEPTIAVLIGRLAEGEGHSEDALAAYRTAADSWDRPAAAQGQLRETVLRYQLGDLKRDDVITQLETLTTIWRGDGTEIEALKILAHLYTEEGRYRDAFYVMRSAMAAHPDSEMTHQIQEEAAATFDSLFLAGKGDAMPAIDALALFYDFRELTPIGSRGDEMIRRLADRLVSVDLLDQAADLLQYQVDERLQGAARAQVATRLAVIYLMNRKADRALATLRATRSADLSNDLRNQRLLLEARALSDLGRRDLALEVIANIDGREAIRLRSDILWAAKRWSESAQQIELMYGDRYKQFEPLSDVERQDILRAEIGYALSEDTLGLGRFREKYAAKMAETPDAHAFQIVSEPFGSSGGEFGAIAHAAASVDTLEGFLRDMRARYPDPSAAPLAGGASPKVAGPPGGPSVSAQPPATRPASPPPPPAKTSGNSA